MRKKKIKRGYLLGKFVIALFCLYAWPCPPREEKWGLLHKWTEPSPYRNHWSFPSRHAFPGSKKNRTSRMAIICRIGGDDDCLLGWVLFSVEKWGQNVESGKKIKSYLEKQTQYTRRNCISYVYTNQLKGQNLRWKILEQILLLNLRYR